MLIKVTLDAARVTRDRKDQVVGRPNGKSRRRGGIKKKKTVIYEASSRGMGFNKIHEHDN